MDMFAEAAKIKVGGGFGGKRPSEAGVGLAAALWTGGASAMRLEAQARRGGSRYVQPTCACRLVLDTHQRPGPRPRPQPHSCPRRHRPRC